MSGVALFVFAFLFGVVVPFVLYILVPAGHDERETMDRQEAQPVARRDTRDRE